LAWPFDSKPNESRRHFEPLLDVEIFRECFERLKPVHSRFEKLKGERELELARIKARIDDRANSPDKVKVCQTQLAVRTKAVEDLQRAKKAAGQECQAQERHELAHREAEQALKDARHLLTLATQKKQQIQNQVQESLAAAETVQATLAAHQA